MPDAHGKLTGIGLIPSGIQPIQNGVTAALFPAKCGHGMAISDRASESAGAAIHDPIAWRAMNGVAMRGEGFGHHGRRLWSK